MLLALLEHNMFGSKLFMDVRGHPFAAQLRAEEPEQGKALLPERNRRGVAGHGDARRTLSL